MVGNSCHRLLSLGEKTGIIALVSAFLLSFVNLLAAAIPLGSFLLLCFIAPFFPGWSFFLPVISRGHGSLRHEPKVIVALTFDDGPWPASTPVLLELLARYRLPATFFVVAAQAARYPELLAKIVAAGHTVGNHSLNHDYFLMLRDRKSLQKDIHDSQEIFRKSGLQPLVFRPPVGITGPRLGRVLAEEGLVAVNFSCRAFDRGNRDVKNLADKILSRLRPGNIIMLHDLPVFEASQEEDWLRELERLFSVLAEEYTILPLEQVIGRPVMRLLP